jgi:hypothetical protein
LRVPNLIRPGLAVAAAGALLLAAAGAALASGKPRATVNSGGASYVAPPGPRSTAAHPIVRGWKAKIIHGVAYAPSYAPIDVQRAIWAGDKIRTKSYCYAGGHGRWNDSCYDCSGTVSFVLHGGGLLGVTMDSSEFESWGRGGSGQWITVYTNPGHAFIEIAGIRFDTSAEGDPNPPSGTGPRWRPLLQDTSGFMARHPSGY